MATGKRRRVASADPGERVPMSGKARVAADERLVDDDYVATKYGVSRSTIKRMRADGELPTVYVRGAARIPKSAVDAWLAAHTNA